MCVNKIKVLFLYDTVRTFSVIDVDISILLLAANYTTLSNLLPTFKNYKYNTLLLQISTFQGIFPGYFCYEIGHGNFPMS